MVRKLCPGSSMKELKGLKCNTLEMTLKPSLSYLPTPLLGQDMTQGQFLSGV